MNKNFILNRESAFSNLIFTIYDNKTYEVYKCNSCVQWAHCKSQAIVLEPLNDSIIT